MSWKFKKSFSADDLVARLHPLVFRVERELSRKGLLELAQQCYIGANQRDAVPEVICMVSDACLRRAIHRVMGTECSPDAEYARTQNQREWVLQKMATESLTKVTALFASLLREGGVPTLAALDAQVTYDPETDMASAPEDCEAAQFKQRAQQIRGALRICLDLHAETA
jgi:hypothetical protein